MKFGEWGPYYSAPTKAQSKELAKLDRKIKRLRPRLAKDKKDKRLAKQLKDLETQRRRVVAKVASVPATISAKPRTIRVLARGNWQDKTGEIVKPAPPEFLTGGKRVEHKSRLDLARWMVDKENPLTSRVFVNRFWARLFGTGLSRNTGDVGYQGEYPSHPELLDHLAAEFVENNWSIKQLVRTIVLSKTYQQSSTPTENLEQQDPDNRLLARQSQIGLPAELIRDNALAVSGLLTTKIGGLSVKPYQPKGYYQHLNFPRRSYHADVGPAQYRRGLYTHWQRTFLHPMLKNFDAPAREECATERSESNTPLQALNLLNDPTFTEASRVLATQLLSGRGRDDTLIPRAYMRSLGRIPSQKEVAILKRFHQQELKRFTKTPAAAKELLSIGRSKAPAHISPVRLAAATSLARVILNLHETITRY